MVFFDGQSSKHSFDLNHFKNVFENKPEGSVIDTISNFKNAVFSTENGFLYLLVIIIILFFISFFVSNQHSQLIRCSLLFSVFSYITYQVGNLCMYLFSMPGNASNLGSYERYHSTILIFVAGIICVSAFLIVDDLPISNTSARSKFFPFCVLFACIISLLLGLKPNFDYYLRTDIVHSERVEFENILVEYKVPAMQKYYVLTDDSYKDTDFYRYLSRYLLSSDDIKVVKVSDLVSMEDLSNDSYIIVVDPGKKQMDYIYDTFGVREQVINLRDFPDI